MRVSVCCRFCTSSNRQHFSEDAIFPLNTGCVLNAALSLPSEPMSNFLFLRTPRTQYHKIKAHAARVRLEIGLTTPRRPGADANPPAGPSRRPLEGHSAPFPFTSEGNFQPQQSCDGSQVLASPWGTFRRHSHATPRLDLLAGTSNNPGQVNPFFPISFTFKSTRR